MFISKTVQRKTCSCADLILCLFALFNSFHLNIYSIFETYIHRAHGCLCLKFAWFLNMISCSFSILMYFDMYFVHKMRGPLQKSVGQNSPSII